MKTKLIYIVLFQCLLFFYVSAQDNLDSTFQSAIEQSGQKNYSKAILIAKSVLAKQPERCDILVFISNNFLWQGESDSALYFVNQAKEKKCSTTEFYDTRLNVLNSLKLYEDLLEACNEAEKMSYSDVENVFQKRLIAYTFLRKYEEGVSLVKLTSNEMFIETDPSSLLYTNLLLKRNKHVISTYYSLDLFDNVNPGLRPQHLASIAYSFPVSIHTLAFRVNYANRFEKNALQIESDLYLQLPNSSYLYLNYGYSPESILFPRHRLGLEYYLTLPAQMEASIGGRYLNYLASNVAIITGHLGKYWGHSWVAVRPFYTNVFKNNSVKQSLSVLGNYRIYGRTELDYFGLELGLGNSPDEVYSTNNSGFNQLEAYRIKLEKNLLLNRTSDLHFGVGYTYEEYSINSFRNRFTFELGFKTRLK